MQEKGIIIIIMRGERKQRRYLPSSLDTKRVMGEGLSA